MPDLRPTWKLLVATAADYGACLRLWRAARVHTAWPDARTLLCVDDGSECLVWMTTLDWTALWIISRGARAADPWTYLLGIDLLDSPETVDAYCTLTGEDEVAWAIGGIPGTSQEALAWRIIVATLATMPEMEAVGAGCWRTRSTLPAVEPPMAVAPLVPAETKLEPPPTSKSLAPPRRHVRSQRPVPRRPHPAPAQAAPALVPATVGALSGRCSGCMRRAQHCTCSGRPRPVEDPDA